MFQLQPPPENQVTPQQRLRLRQPRLRGVRVAGLQALLGEILQGGDGDLRGALALRHLQRLGVAVERFGPGAQVAQHPAGEVHRAAREARDLAALHLRGVAGERGQGGRRLARQRVRVPGEQERVQGSGGVLHPHLAAGRRAQQRQRLIDPALMGP